MKVFKLNDFWFHNLECYNSYMALFRNEVVSEKW